VNVRIKPEQKAEMPKAIACKMQLWREGFGPMPVDYIRFNRDLADVEWSRIAQKYNLTLISRALVPDGWMDGMRIREVHASRADGEEITLRWIDGSQCFFLSIPHAGSGALWESDLCSETKKDNKEPADCVNF
tara:strand:- start:2534 stop:2932 length:399 start_codon:yes stop_codon:yes gene_type:complete